MAFALKEDSYIKFCTSYWLSEIHFVWCTCK